MGLPFWTPDGRGVSILEMAFPRLPGEPQLLLLLLLANKYGTQHT